MTIGELILARINLGAVVKSWLKFFYTVHYEDYCNAPITRKDKNGTAIQIEPKEVKFDGLKSFSNGKLWEDHNSHDYKWVESIRKKRNMIHSFKYREIEEAQEFLDDISRLYCFVDNVLSHFPLLEDCILFVQAIKENSEMT